MIKRNCILKLFVIGALFFIFCFALFNSIKYKQNETYFNVWLYYLQEKNSIGKFLKIKDPEYGYLIDDEQQYKSNNIEIDLKNIRIIFKYVENKKLLDVYVLDMFNKISKNDIFYSSIPNELLKEICNDIIMIFYENLMIPVGKKNIDITKDFINNINFIFTEPKDTIYSNMIIKYKRDKKNEIFNFSYYDTISFDECIVNCKDSK